MKSGLLVVPHSPCGLSNLVAIFTLAVDLGLARLGLDWSVGHGAAFIPRYTGRCAPSICYWCLFGDPV